MNLKKTQKIALLATLLGLASGEVLADKISAGRHHSAIVRADGSLWTWGSSHFGQIGDPTQLGNKVATPQQIGSKMDWTQVCSGEAHSMAVDASNTLYVWGDNSFGQLGEPLAGPITEPTASSFSAPIASVASSAHSSYLIDVDGTVYSAGRNNDGQLGLGDQLNSDSFSAISLPNKALKVSAGQDFAIALTHDGKLYAWGSHRFGQLGLGAGNAIETSPVQIGTDSDWKDVSCGSHHVVAIKNNGDMYTWGKNSHGQATGSGHIDHPQMKLNNVDAISAGREHSHLIKNAGEIWAFGRNSEGQLGTGAQGAPETSIAQIPDSTWITSVAGPYHNLALKADGTLYAWGLNSSLQLGTDANAPDASPSPVVLPAIDHPIISISPVTAVTAGEVISLQAMVSTGDISLSWSEDITPGSPEGFEAPTGNNTAYVTPAPGRYELSLTATRNDLGSVSSVAKIVIEVQPAKFGSMIWGTHNWSTSFIDNGDR